MIKNITYYYFLFILSLIVLYPKIPLFNVSGTFVAIRLEDIFLALGMLLWLVFLYQTNGFKKLLNDKLFLTGTVFFIAGLVSLFSAIFITHTVSFHLGLLHYLRRIEVIYLMFVYLTIIKTKKQLYILFFVIFIVTLLVNLYGLGQLYLDWNVISTTNSEFSKGQFLKLTPGGRINSTFAGHYDLAIYLMMIITIFLGLLIFIKNKFLKVSFASLLLLSSAILVLTAARLSFVATLIGIFVVLFLAKQKKYILIFMLILIPLFLYPSHLRDRLVSTLTINIQQQGERYEVNSNQKNNRQPLNIFSLPISSKSAESTLSATISGKLASDIAPGEPINTTELGVYRSFRIRLLVEWPAAIRSFYKNPLLGTGYSSLGLAVDNDFLRLLAEVGIFGAWSFMLFMFVILKRIYIAIKSSNKFLRLYSIGVFSMTIGFIINATFIDVFEASKIASVFWILIGTNLALINIEKNEN